MRIDARGLWWCRAFKHPVPGTDDSLLFTNFCVEHFDIKPYVDSRRVKRIGRSVPQKLLVHLLSEHSAAEIIQCSRDLHHCEDSYIARSVFFNRDLSPAEAKAAYDKRVARRLAKAAVQGNQRQTGDTDFPTEIRGHTAAAAGSLESHAATILTNSF
jgi:hypothetical protein